jgi:hypothetical protein
MFDVVMSQLPGGSTARFSAKRGSWPRESHLIVQLISFYFNHLIPKITHVTESLLGGEYAFGYLELHLRILLQVSVKLNVEQLQTLLVIVTRKTT